MKLTESQARSLRIFAESPIGGYYRSAQKLCWARPEALHRLGLIVPNEPRGTGWSLTDAGRAALEELAR